MAKLGTGFVGAGLYYMNDKREAGATSEDRTADKRPSAAEYFLSDKGPAQTADRVGFTATRNCASDDPMKALRQMAFTAAHSDDIRMAAVQASAKAAGLSYDDYVKQANPFRGRKGTKPVYSMSLSFPPGDPHATKDNMLKAADEVRNVLGIKDHQCLIVEHTDTKHPHVHLIINRVHPTTGKYASVSNDRLKLSEWALDWERRHGKVVCPSREPNQQQRAENREAKQAARAAGDCTAKSGYVKNRGLPQSEIDFWNEHGSANLSTVRAARSERQKRDWAEHHRVTASKLRDVDWYHERANGKALDRIDRTLRVLKGHAGQPSIGKRQKESSFLDRVFGAARGAAFGIVARIANRSDIAKLEKIKTQLRRERDIRRADVAKGRRQAAEKLKRIHAWQNRLDEKRCRTYRESDTRDYRKRRDRWDMGKLKPPIHGTVVSARYEVEESRNTRKAIEDRRKLNEPLEMKPIPRADTPYAKRDPSVATAAERLGASDDRDRARPVSVQARTCYAQLLIGVVDPSGYSVRWFNNAHAWR
ncbi:MAG: relaxase/mobilization nuclease domain-containing protein [Pseudomonadota bacterium]